jgi:D-glycero-D-manno-heptose 1,7-bisphosphate phosphatase
MKLVLLDRDGVINEDSDEYIKSPEEFHMLPGVPQTIARLNFSGVKCALATNQSGIARGLFTLEGYLQIQQKLNKKLAEHDAYLDGVFFCPHGPDEQCECRKPEPGLLLKALSRFTVMASNAVFIGDSIRDIQAAVRADITPILVRTGNGVATEKSRHPDLKNVAVFDSLVEAVDEVLKTPN